MTVLVKNIIAVAFTFASVSTFVAPSMAATPGLPFTEDFSSTALRDAAKTSASWSTVEQQAYLASAINPPTGSGFSVAGTAVGSEVDTTRSVVLGDVDNDGDLDLIAGNHGQTKKLYKNDGNGGFSATGIALGSDTNASIGVALGDVDGDGDPDLVAGNSVQTNKLYLNDGNGTFSAAGITVGSETDNTISVVLGDVDSDGDLDLITGNDGATNKLYLNNGSGGFPVTGIAVGGETDSTRSVALGDVDGDGDLDLVAGNLDQSNRLYLNNGNGGFSATGAAVGSETDSTRSVTLGDVDGDGDLDIIAGNSDGDTNKLYLNSGSGGFSATGTAVGSETDDTIRVVLGDVDGDGDLDLITGNWGQTNKLYLNNGNGGFTVNGNAGSETDSTYSVVLGDVDGDGDLDLIAGNLNQTNKLYLNNGSGGLTTLGVVTSTTVNAGEEVRAITLSAVAAVNTPTTRNTAIDYFVSNNGGAKWYRTLSGVPFVFPSIGTDVRWKAELRSLSPAITPILSEISVVNADNDNDGLLDAADLDDDNDGTPDVSDAFPLNGAESVDTDVDGIGNNADTDDDGDSVADISDNCPLFSNSSQINTDGDSQGDACDSDDDNDTVADISDNCSLVSNSTQIDTDGDNQGDACDSDDDDDSVADAADNCPLIINALQTNTDGDSQGDACDADDDNDGVVDASDVFPLDPTETVDTDGDNIGDNSDPLPNDASTLNNVFGANKADKSGASVAFAGDFNKDGYGDYIIGAPGFDAPGAKPIKDAGRAEVISGKNGTVLASINGTAAKDALGTAVAGNGDINNDGYDDVVVGAPKAGATHAGAVTILYGPDGASTQTINCAVEKSLFGTALALGDVNGDSRADLLVGAPKDDRPGVPAALIDAGSVTVYSGNGLGVLGMPFYGATAKAYAGSSVASGDLNNDGNADIIIGAPGDGGTGSVRAYNLAGSVLLQKSGDIAKAQFGKSVASGDVNGDGYDDVLVGAPAADDAANGLKDTGSITVFSGADGEILAKKYGAVAKANLGNSVAVGDVDGDSNADLIAGAWKDEKAAVPKAIKDTGSVSVWSGEDYAPIATLYGDLAKDYFGAAVSAGDINSDGRDDLIIGVPGFDSPSVPKAIKDAGMVTVLSGNEL